MSVQAATENRALDQLVTMLQSIVGGGGWLTNPAGVTEGIPNDAVPTEAAPQLFVLNVKTEPLPEGNAGVSRHQFRLHFLVWVVALTARDVNSAKADILRAVFAGEGAATTALGQPFWPGEFEQKVELSPAGFQVGTQHLFLDVSMDHATP